MRNPAFKLPPEQEAIWGTCFHPRGTFVEFDEGEIEQSIPARFESIVRRYPDRIAIKMNDEALTYGALNKASNRIARTVRGQLGQTNEPVALLIEQGASLITAIIGVLKAGKIYVPLDPAFPRARIVSMLEDAKVRLVVTNQKYLALTEGLVANDTQLLNIDQIDSSLSEDNLNQSLSPDTVAYIIYTSGSTGRPKGVVQSHRNLLHNIMTNTNNLHICADDRLLLLSSPSFADAVRTTYAALLNGAGLFPLAIREKGMAGLCQALLEQEITIYRSVPTVFRQFAGTLTGQEEFPKLRLINLTGEPVYKTDLELYKKYFPRSCVFVNRLGTSETGTISYYFLNRDTQISSNIVPVGYAAEHVQVLLLGQEGEELGFNQVGEIAIKSRYLSPGYWNRPDLTRTAFLPEPNGEDERVYITGDVGRMLPDGCLIHLGRKESQIKIRGYLVELPAIETALLELASIKEAAVVARQDGFGDPSMVAYLIAATDPAPTIAQLRASLSEKLPNYMIPSRFVFLDSLPRTGAGKVDHAALPDVSKSRPELDTPYVVPSSVVESELARIWAEVLFVDRVGIHDNFFDLGGHSLAATRIVSQVTEKFQTEIPLQSLFHSPTIVAMAEVIAQIQAKKLNEMDVTGILAELESLSDEQAKQMLAERKMGDVQEETK
jgi:amino acid adenylation domain-containing protein